MSRAFAPESMAHCAAKGHRWRYVRAWHAVGWQECQCCGQTLDGLCDLVPVVIEPPAPVCEAEPAESVAPPSSPVPESEAPRYEDATAPVAKKRYRRRHAERDAEIRRLAAAGTNQREIARTFGIHQSRVCQIVREDNAAVVAAGES